MRQIKSYLLEYSFIFLWVAAGAINKFFAAGIVFITFLLFLKKQMHVKAIIGFWVLLVFSDSLMTVFSFSVFVKPLIISLIGVYSFLYARKNRVNNTFYKPFLLFFIYTLIISFFSDVFLIDFQKSLSYFLVFFSIPVFVKIIIAENQTVDLFKKFIFFGNLILIASILIALFLPEYGSLVPGRLNGIFRNPNGVGIFLFMYSLISYTIFNLSEFPKIVKRATVILILIALFYCASRSAFGAILLFIGGVYIAKKSTWVYVIISLSFIFVYDYLFEFTLVVIESMGYSDALRVDTLDQASGRIYIWQATWLEIQEKFYFGHGYTYSEKVEWVQKYKAFIPGLYEHLGNIHHSFLSLWLNTGIIGLILYVIGWLRTISVSLKKSPLTLPIFVSVTFSASYESWLIASLNPYTIQLLIIFSLLLYYNIEKLELNSNP